MRLVRKLIPCDACGVINAKAVTIPRDSYEGKKVKDIGERIFVDMSGVFLLTETKWNKCMRNKLHWHGISH